MHRIPVEGSHPRSTPAAGRRDQRLTEIQPLLRDAAAAALARYGQRVSREAVSELAQEATCRLLESGTWRALPPAGEPRRLALYLLRVARSALVDDLRAQRAAKRGGGQVESREALAEVGRLPEHHDPSPTPEEELIATQENARLSERVAVALAGPHRDRNARLVTRWAIDGWTGAELAAAEAGLSASSIHSVLWRARQALVRHGAAALLGA